jgi:2-deoxy-D-gluconate 3-dehydrogenase
VSAQLESSGSEVEEAVRRHGRLFEGHRVDLADRAAVADLAGRLTADRPVDILVNNAGTIRRAPAAQHSDADWDHVLAVNLTSQFVLAREVGRGMLERGSGKIIFTASLLSFQGGVNVPGYTAAKSAIAGLTRALANEWSGRGVNVNAIAPGYIATDNTQALRDDPDRDRAILERIPAGRPVGTTRGPRRRCRLPGRTRLGLRARHGPRRGRRLAGPLTVCPLHVRVRAALAGPISRRRRKSCLRPTTTPSRRPSTTSGPPCGSAAP